MLPAIEYAFRNAPVKLRIARELYSRGLSIRNGKVYSRDFEIPIKVVADVLGVDRKTMYAFVSKVERDFVLQELFARLKPRPDIADMAPILGYEVLEFKADQANLLKVLDYLRKRVKIRTVYYDQGSALIVYEPGLDEDEIRFVSSLVADMKVVTPDPKKRKIICEKCEVEFCPRRERR